MIPANRIMHYVPGNPSPDDRLGTRITRDALVLCRALGYDLNTLPEFAVEDGVPYTRSTL